MANLLNLTWVIVFTGLLILFFVPSKLKWFTAMLTVVLTAFITSTLAFRAIMGNPFSVVFDGGVVAGNVLIRIDQLSAWFILIINFTSITGLFYGEGYLKAYTSEPRKLSLHWIFYVIFQLSMIWVCMIQNGLVFLIAWEIMSISSMMLVVFEGHKPSTIKAGLNYLVQMHISVVLLTIGFIWLYFKTGSFSFDAFSQYFAAFNNVGLFMIFFVGFGLKAGFIPLHTWLPHAHPAAPSHISGVMSGVIVKLGIYGILRVAFNLKSEFFVLGEILVVVSVLTSLFGIINAAVHRDIKKMLAYCTIENIGIIGIGIGIGLIGVGANNPILYFLGFGGALLHVLNHSLFKSLLFFSAGSIYQQTHTRNMDKLGGLMKSMPRTALLFLMGSVAIGGLPPFNGFISEFLIYSGLIEGLKLQSSVQILIMLLSLAGLSIVGGLSILTFTKTFGTVFLGTERQKSVHKPHEVSILMLIPQYFIVAAMLTIAFFPGFYIDFIGRILTSLSFRPLISGVQPFGNYPDILGNISFYSFVLIILIVVFALIRKLVTARVTRTISPTWGCGYTVPSSSLQYTGKSFSKSLSKMFNFVVIERKQYDELNRTEIFPEVREYKSHYFDFFEYRFIKFMVNRLIYSANYFNFVQNGRVQSYILYGLVFMLIVFLLTIFRIVR